MNIDTLRKVRALVERGTPGEKAAAEKLLASLLSKHGLTEADLATEERRALTVKFRTKWERDLAMILAFKLDPDSTCWRVRGGRGFKMRVGDAIEFEVAWPILKRSFQEEMRVFYRAFLSRNDLLLDESLFPDQEPPTPEEIERAYRADLMAEGIKKADRWKQIERKAVGS